MYRSIIGSLLTILTSILISSSAEAQLTPLEDMDEKAAGTINYCNLDLRYVPNEANQQQAVSEREKFCKSNRKSIVTLGYLGNNLTLETVKRIYQVLPKYRFKNSRQTFACLTIESCQVTTPKPDRGNTGATLQIPREDHGDPITISLLESVLKRVWLNAPR